MTVGNITPEELKNGKKSLIVECYTNDSKEMDSVFHFQLDTKVK